MYIREGDIDCREDITLLYITKKLRETERNETEMYNSEGDIDCKEDSTLLLYCIEIQRDRERDRNRNV